MSGRLSAREPIRSARIAAALPVVGALAALGAGCGGSGGASDTSAGRFMVRVLQEELSGRWAAQWADLHPGQPRLITHAVRDRGRWTWILGPSFLDAVSHHRCLDGSPLGPGR